MDIAVQVGVIAALVLALASIFGGVVLYRGSTQVGWRAAAVGAIAGGAGVLVVVDPGVLAGNDRLLHHESAASTSKT